MSCNHNHTNDNPETFCFDGWIEENCPTCLAFGQQLKKKVVLAEFEHKYGHDGIAAFPDGKFYTVHCSYSDGTTYKREKDFHSAALTILDIEHEYAATVWPDRIAQWPSLQMAMDLHRFPVGADDLVKHSTAIVTLACPDSEGTISLSLSEWAALTHGGPFSQPGKFAIYVEDCQNLVDEHNRNKIIVHLPHDWWTPAMHHAYDFIRSTAEKGYEIIVSVPDFTTEDRVNRSQNPLDYKATDQESVPSIVNPDGLDESQLMESTILAELRVMKEIDLTVEITPDGTFISSYTAWGRPCEAIFRKLTLQEAALMTLELQTIVGYQPHIYHDRIAAIPELQEAIKANEVK